MMICLQLLEKFKTKCQNQSEYSHLLYLFIIKNLKAIEIYKRHLVSSKLEFFFAKFFQDIDLNVCLEILYSLSISRNRYEFTIFLQTYYCIANCFANSLWNHGIYYDFTIFFAKFLWIHFLFSIGPIFTMDPLSFCEFSINSLYFSRTYFKFPIINAN